MTVRHVAVWIDHKEAKVFHIEPEGFDTTKIKAAHHHVTRKAEEQGRHGPGSDHFYEEVAAALVDAEEILIVGPSSAKLDFIRSLHKHNHLIEPKVVGVETLDHPTDNQIVAYVRHYFQGKDRMLGLTP